MGKLWDMFLFKLGVCPRNYFEQYVHDSMNVFESIEHYTHVTSAWAKVVSKKVGVGYPDNDSDDEGKQNNKGMYG